MSNNDSQQTHRKPMSSGMGHSLKERFCMPGKKLQSAMEYLITYGWLLLVVGVVLAVLFSLGTFNPSKFVSNECLLPAGFSATNLQLFQNGTLYINLLQVTQSTVNVTAIGCAQNISVANMESFTPTANEIAIPIGGNYTFSMPCRYANDTAIQNGAGTAFEGYVAINYTDTVSSLPHTTFCRLFVKTS